MALIKPIHGEMKGSIGGNTYQGNPYGQVVRQRVKPVDPSTPSQALFRTYFNNASTIWKTVDVATQLLWTDYCATAPRLNKFGDSIILANRAMCMSLNSFRQIVGLAPASAPPVQPGNAVFYPFFAIAASTATGVFIDAPAVVPTDPVKVLVRLRILPGNQRNYFTGPYNVQYVFKQGDVLPVTIVNPGTFSVGDIVYIALRSIDDEGRLSPVTYTQIPINS